MLLLSSQIVFVETAIARSLLETFLTLLFIAKNSISSLLRPTFKRPLIIAIVAGIALLERTVSSTISAVSIFFG